MNREQVIRFITQTGPIIPVQLAKEINQSILLSSAILSELVSKKELKVSTLKIGGTPLYLIPGQEEKLQNFSHKLPSKEKDAYTLIRERKVLYDSSLAPILRVALRSLKDFAVPLKVTYNNKTVIFWKWYLTQSAEAEPLIKNILHIHKLPPKPSEEKPIPQLIPPTTTKPYQNNLSETITTRPPKTHPSIQKIPVTIPTQKPILATLSEKTIKPEQKKVVAKKQKSKKEKIIKDQFIDEVSSYLTKNNIEIIRKQEIKKGEADFIINLPTVLGNIEYFVKAKSKKRISEADLSTTLLLGKEKNLPVLFIAQGDLSNKLIALLNTRLKGLIYKKIKS